jgi:anti-anti-sigma factor
MSTKAIEISVREVEDCMVLDIKAENFTYPHSAILKNHVAHLLEGHHRYFVLNMELVKVVDSFGLASVISTLKMIKERGGNMALYGLNNTVNRLVEITHLDRVLEIWTSESQAIYCLKEFSTK